MYIHQGRKYPCRSCHYDAINPYKDGLQKYLNKNCPPTGKSTLECLSSPKMYMVEDIQTKTLSPEGQNSSHGPRGHAQKGDIIFWGNFDFFIF